MDTQSWTAKIIHGEGGNDLIRGTTGQYQGLGAGKLIGVGYEICQVGIEKAILSIDVGFVPDLVVQSCMSMMRFRSNPPCYVLYYAVL